MRSNDEPYTLPVLHVLLAHLSQDNIKFMIRNELLSYGNNVIFDPSGHLECESCRIYKCQSLQKGSPQFHLTRQLPSEERAPLSEIPEDILLQSNFVPVAPLDLIHSDGFQFDFPSGAKVYFYIFIDHVTDFRMVYSVPARTEFLTALQAFHAFCFFYHKTNIKGLRMDNGGEMSSNEFYEFARFHGIHVQRCAAYDHHQNGVAERAVRTAEEAALTMIHHCQLSVIKYIMYAVINATQIRNKCATKKSGAHLATPHQLFTGVKPRIEDIHPTGEVCYSFVKKDQRKLKYDPKARKCLFLCEDFERKAYVLLDVENRSIITSRDVRFPRHGATLLFPAAISPLSTPAELSSYSTGNGTVPPSPGSSHFTRSQAIDSSCKNGVVQQQPITENYNGGDISISELAGILARSTIRVPPDMEAPPTPALNNNDAFVDGVEFSDSLPQAANSFPLGDGECVVEEEVGGEHQEPTVDNENTTENSECGTEELVPVAIDVAEPAQHSEQAECSTSSSRTPSYVRKKNIKYYSEDFVNIVYSAFPETPTTFRKAMMSSEKIQWNDAMKAELDALHREATWQIVPRKKNMFVVKCKWVFKVKVDEKGAIVRFKARLVAMGFTQTYGVNYDETYSPVLQATTRRLIFCLASDPSITTVQADVETAFLQANLDHVIHLEPPPGMEIPEGHVLRLNKALYGLKQSPLLWYQTAREFFESLGFICCVSDVCLFVYTSQDGKVFLSIYVDDLTISSKSRILVEWVVSQTKQRFPLRDIKPLSWTVGLRVQNSDDSIQISQSSYIEALFDKVIQDRDVMLQKRKIPMAVDLVLHGTSTNLLSRPSGVKEYQRLIGSLNYLAHSSRPDISFAVNALSSYLQCPRELHLVAAKRVLVYLNSSRNLGIVYSASSENNLYAYCDASLVSKDSADGRSTTGYAVFFNNNLVSWRSCRQTVVSLSTMESELVAIATALTALQHIRNTLTELGYCVPNYQIFTDSLPAVRYLQTTAEGARPRTRHLALRFHFIRSEVEEGILSLVHVRSEEQTADILTKPLPRPLFEQLRMKYLLEKE